jgi:hypothetical protein
MISEAKISLKFHKFIRKIKSGLILQKYSRFNKVEEYTVLAAKDLLKNKSKISLRKGTIRLKIQVKDSQIVLQIWGNQNLQDL